jgi:ATP-dependent helicase HepA
MWFDGDRMLRTASSFEHARVEPGRDAFRIGDIVTLRGDARRLGVITDARGGPSERSYVVLFDGRGDVVAEGLLRLATGSLDAEPRPVSSAEFRARLTARQLVAPGRQELYSLHDGRVDALPHHFAPTLSLLRTDTPRLLIADDMGLGKSTAVGLVLRELRARNAAGSVAIVCSRALAAEQKWQRELRRFDEAFVELDAAGLQRCMLESAASGAWPAGASRVILPFSLFDNGLLFGTADTARRLEARGLATLQEPPRFDLLIVDEAHAVASGDGYARQGVKILSEHAKAVLYLTATPLELENDVLFSLLAMLRPDVSDPRAALLRAGESNASGDGFPASQICRARRRDLGRVPARRALTVRVDLTAEQMRTHELLRTLQATVRRHAKGSRAAAFLLTTIARQAASCLHGVAPFLDDLFASRVSPLESAEIDRAFVPASAGDIEYLRYAASEFLAAARSLPPEDPKLERLLALIEQRDGEDLNGPSRGKVVVCTAFPQTLSYLARRLRAAGIRIGVLDGASDEHGRAAVGANFARPQGHARASDVLLVSETGAEGLDLGFCKALVNYDIPLDPARIEERLGRLERPGGDAGIDVYSFVTPGTIEFAPFERVAKALGIFERPVASNEGLFADVAREVRLALEDPALEGDDLDERLRCIGENAAVKIARQTQLETAQADLFAASRSLRELADEVRAATSSWLEPYALAGFVERYLKLRFGPRRAVVSGSGALRDVRLGRDERAALRRELAPERGLPDNAARALDAWLAGEADLATFVFTRAAAAEHPLALLLTPVHPLVRHAAAALASDEDVVACSTRGADASIRRPYAVYQWQTTGLRHDARFVTVADAPGEEDLLNSLAAAEFASGASVSIGPDEMKRLARRHDRELRRSNLLHQEETVALVSERRERAVAAHAARVAALQQQLALATNARTRKMRASELLQAEIAHRRTLAELSATESGAGITARLIGYGVSTSNSPEI